MIIRQVKPGEGVVISFGDKQAIVKVCRTHGGQVELLMHGPADVTLRHHKDVSEFLPPEKQKNRTDSPGLANGRSGSEPH